MQINKIFGINYIKPNRTNVQKSVDNKGLEKDKFIKSNVSFGSKEINSGVFILDLTQIIIDSLLNTTLETIVGEYIDAFSSKRLKTFFERSKRERIETYNYQLLQPNYVNIINSLLSNSGIITVSQWEKFIKTYQKSETKRTFQGQEVEAIQIYGILDNKDDLSNFSEILLELFNEEKNADDADFNILNLTTEFMKKNLGLTKFSDLDEKFYYLKARYNNFKNRADRIEALEYIVRTYYEKIDFINLIKNSDESLAKISAEEIYKRINDITDYLYDNEKDNQNTCDEDDLEIIKTALEADKLKSSGLSEISPIFNDYKTPEDKIDLYKFLMVNNLSSDDFNALAKKSLITDYDILSGYLSKSELTSIIAEEENISLKEAEKMYIQFRGEFNAVYEENNQSNDNIIILLRLMKQYNVKDTSQFIHLYNRITNQYKKRLTNKEFKDFIELFKYNVYPDILSASKEKNISAAELLKQQKENFLQVQPAIEEFLRTDESSIFVGKSELDIYKEFNIQPSSKEQIKKELTVISQIAESTEEYQQKQTMASEFSKYFKNKEELIKFIRSNNIKLDNSEEDNIFQENCKNIFEFLYDKNNLEKSLERINNISRSGFLIKSKQNLTEFLNKVNDPEKMKKILSVIADRNVTSINSLKRFINEYKTPNTKGEDLLDIISEQDENLSLDEIKNMLQIISSKLSKLNIPFKLNSSNLRKIDIPKYAQIKTYKTKDIYNLLNIISGAEQPNTFVSALPQSLVNCSEYNSAYKIASELIKKYDEEKDSYKNIIKLLKLDKASLQLPEDCNDYVYINAIIQALPKDFINFINSDDWINYKNDPEQLPNIELHAKLRLIDRFILNETNNINDLYSKKSEEKLKDIIRTIYTTEPSEIKGTDYKDRIILDFPYNSSEIETIISTKGEMITIYQKKDKTL